MSPENNSTVSEGFNPDKIAQVATELGELLAKRTEENGFSHYHVTSVLVTLFFEVLFAGIDQRIEEKLKALQSKSEDGKHGDIYQ